MSILLERLQKKLQGDILSIRQDKQYLTWRLAKKAPFPKSGRAVLSVHRSSTFAPLQELADFFLRNYKDTCGKESTLFNLELLEIFSSYFKHFLKKKNFNRRVILLCNNILRENSFNSPFDEKWSKTLILEILYLTIPAYNLS